MHNGIALLLTVFLQNAVTDVSGQPIPLPFDPIKILNETELTQGCLMDVTSFSTGITQFTTTFAACRRQQGGCTKAQQKLLDDNIFAIKQLDAFGKIPSGILDLTIVSSGSYSECMDVKAPYQVQYCYANSQITNMTGLAPKEVGMPSNFKVGPRLAACMPERCTEKDVANFLNAANKGALLPVEFTGTSCVPKYNTYSLAFWIYMSVLGFFVSWAIVATAVDYVWQKHYKDKEQNKAVQVLLAYSVYTNGSLIMNVSPPKKGTIKSLSAIRFVSMTWVAAGHILMQDVIGDTVLPVFTVWDASLSNTITNGFFSVDTFFLLSGLLVTYIFFKSKPKAKFVKNPMVWVMFYVHRYLRLTPPIMMFVGFYTILDPYINGPWVQANMDFIAGSVEMCKNYWWRNMLYINNFFSAKETCYIITWYLAVDTQLYFIAPVFIIALFISPIFGLLLLFACIAASVGYVYAMTIKNSLPAIVFGIPCFEKFWDFFTDQYEKPWTRCPPFLIGMAAGYILALGKKPRLNKFFIVPLWILAAAVALASLYGSHDYQAGDDAWSSVVSATYNNFSRIGWALAVAWVIMANHWGWGGLIANFMDHPAWQPLGRLSYCGYITHFFLLRYIHNLDDRPTHFTSLWRMYIYMVIPTIVVSYVFSFFWSCLFEVPVVKLEKMLTDGLLPKKTPTAKPDIEEGKSKEPVEITVGEPKIRRLTEEGHRKNGQITVGETKSGRLTDDGDRKDGQSGVEEKAETPNKEGTGTKETARL